MKVLKEIAFHKGEPVYIITEDNVVMGIHPIPASDMKSPKMQKELSSLAAKIRKDRTYEWPINLPWEVSANGIITRADGLFESA